MTIMGDYEYTPIEKLMRARIKLNKDNPFFAYLAMHLKFQEKKDLPFETMGVNARGDLYYSKKFVEKIDIIELQTVLCHEVMHVALLHLARVHSRNKLLWNISADVIINGMLKRSKMAEIKNSLYPNDDDEFVFQGIKIKNISKKNTEQIYDELDRKIPKSLMKALEAHYGKNHFDKHDYGKAMKGLSQEEKEKLKEIEGNWKRRMSEAYQHSKLAGKAPAGMERFVDDLLNPKMNWKALLQKYIIKEIPTDYTYARCSKRSVATGFYMPSIKRDTVEIGIAIDTSGSISTEELTAFLSEVVSIARSHDAIRMKLVTHDYKIHDDLEVRNGSIKKIMDLKPKGGGGTSHKDVYKWAEKNRIKCLVCFSDMYSDLEEISTPIRSIFVSTTDQTSPFGVNIKYEMRDTE